MAGKTTTIRFSKNRRTNVSDSMMAALAEDDSESEAEGEGG